MAIPTAISLMADHIFTWLFVFAACATLPATLGFISWWWVIGPGTVLGAVLAGDLVAGWRWSAARERAIQRARDEAA